MDTCLLVKIKYKTLEETLKVLIIIKNNRKLMNSMIMGKRIFSIYKVSKKLNN